MQRAWIITTIAISIILNVSWVLIMNDSTSQGEEQLSAVQAQHREAQMHVMELEIRLGNCLDMNCATVAEQCCNECYEAVSQIGRGLSE